jgi:threonine/homoserine/homoserine lactone efflux protein
MGGKGKKLLHFVLSWPTFFLSQELGSSLFAHFCRMEWASVLSFLAAAVALSFMPGPDNIYVLTESLTAGRRKGLYVVFGLITGVLLHTTLAATGLALLLKQSLWLYTTVKWAGAVYLLYLAWLAYTEKPLNFKEQSAHKAKAILFWPSYRKGFFMNVLNPKVTLFFLAFLPQFVSPAGWPVFQQLMFLGLLFLVQGLIIFSGIALLAGKAQTLLNRGRFWVYARWFKISILVILAIFLVL